MSDLVPFFNPTSVAIVGAAERLTSSGGAVLRNLLSAGYAGRIVPVNPKGGEMLGLAVATSLAQVAPSVELVVILVRPDLILDVVREGIASNHGNFLILPGGFAEAGDLGKARDAELRALAAQHKLTIAGPNCAGIINLLNPQRRFAATFLRDLPRGGGVAFLSQSGAIAEEVIEKSHAMRIPIGVVVSIGNAMRLHVESYLEYCKDNADCTAVLLYLESVSDEARFIRIARETARVKPVIVLLGGRTPGGRAAARAHTGTRGWSDAQMDDLCGAAGALRVKSLRELLLAGKAFGCYRQGIGARVLVLSNSGGPGVICTDRALDAGLQIVDLPPEFAQRLRAFLPPEASVANPLDLLADAREDRFDATFEAALDCAPEHFDAILMIHVVPFMVDAAPVIDALAKRASSARVPILHAMMGTLEQKQAWFEKMEASSVPVFNDVEEMAAAAGLLARYGSFERSTSDVIPAQAGISE
jgi:acyl-CoA synthetase (NDP forming)